MNRSISHLTTRSRSVRFSPRRKSENRSPYGVGPFEMFSPECFRQSDSRSFYWCWQQQTAVCVRVWEIVWVSVCSCQLHTHLHKHTHTHTPRTSVCLIQTFLLVWICVWVYGESKQILKICSCVKCVFMSAAARRLAAMSNWNRLESFSRQIQWVEVKSCCCWIFCCRYLCSGKNKNLASLVSELYLSPPKPDLLCLHQGSLKR